MTVRVGVIGVGMIGQDHVRRLSTVLPGAAVVALADADPARARDVAQSVPADPAPRVVSQFEIAATKFRPGSRV